MGDDFQGRGRPRADVAAAPETGRADAVFADAFPSVSRARIQRLMKEGYALVNGEPTRKAARVQEGAELTLELPVRGRPVVTTDLEIPVLFEDASLIVIDKPAGVSVHSGPEDTSATVARWFEARYPDDAARFDVERPGIVHRLDKGTSGVMVLARTPAAQTRLSQSFADRVTSKQYVALVEGAPDRPRAVIDAPIGRHLGDRTRMAILDTGRPSKTEYEVLGTAHRRSLMLLKPVTGRTHQLRVHLAALGLPVVDDVIYGKSGAGRHLLHAWRLELPHPDGGSLSATAELPDDMAEAVRAIGLEKVALQYTTTASTHRGGRRLSRPVRTRYAPSPTGDPHIGNIRSALFSWALARANGGQFLLRIEDTDRARLVETSLKAIIESLEWLGIDYDEGPDKGGDHGPYFQSQRLDLYQNTAAKLIDSGNAYRCFCTPERLTEMREAQARAKRPPGYDGLCRNVPKDESDDRAASEEFVIRFAMKLTGTTVLEDAVRGTVRFDNSLQNDFVIIKSDGFPTYHLAFIVDDTEMEITHVVRGDEWISSAPKHVQIYEALGWEQPIWAHLPLILGPDGKKLSKRDGDVAALDYRDAGYLPEAMLNFLAFLGWSLDDKTSYITRDELTANFSLERVVPNPAVFDNDRLDHLNGFYIREMDAETWREAVASRLASDLPAALAGAVDAAFVNDVAPLLKERVKKLVDIAEMVTFLFGQSAPDYDGALLPAKLGAEYGKAVRVLDAAFEAFDGLPAADWNAGAIEAAIRAMQDTLDLKLRKYIPTLYVAIMGKAQGIPLFDSLVILGRERTLRRLQIAREMALKGPA